MLGYFAGATGFLLFGIWIGGGIATTPANAIVLFPFLLLFSGLGQLAAAMWSYKARDAVAASIHGVWGGFWTAYGLLWLLDTTHVTALPASDRPLQPRQQRAGIGGGGAGRVSRRRSGSTPGPELTHPALADPAALGSPSTSAPGCHRRLP